jgi:transcriptional regulator with XRE-family HTH domain
MGIPENIKALREAAGLSQTQLAKLARVSQQLISQLERGENTTTKYLPQIARALGKTVADLDPSFAPVYGDPTFLELRGIFERLDGHPEWQQYLLDQARAVESRVRSLEAHDDRPAKVVK